jgi:hypothetical protein
MMKTDWEIFREHVPWFARSGENFRIDVEHAPSCEMFSPSSTFRLKFPMLTKLLAGSRVSAVDVRGATLFLYTWQEASGRRCGWLCESPPKNTPLHLHPHHCLLCESFGGGLEAFNQPNGTWVMNLNWWLCASRSLAIQSREIQSIQSYIVDTLESPKCSIIGGLHSYIRFAQEANGNFTAYRQSDGDVVMFAPDHAHENLVSVRDCPPYSFYRIRQAPTFVDWVEQIADQWLRHIEKSV